MTRRWKGGFFALFFVLMTPIAYAQRLANEWVVDSSRILSNEIKTDLARNLSDIAKSRDVFVRVFIIHTSEGTSFDKQVEDIIRIWESHHPLNDSSAKTGYLMLNAQTGETRFVLGHQVERSDSLLQGLANLEKYVLAPAMKEGNVRRAAWEGALGLTSILENWSLPHSKTPATTLFFLMWGVLFILGGAGVAWYLRTPMRNLTTSS